MKKALAFSLIFILLLVMFPLKAQAAGASFSISGPDTLKTGDTGTYIVKVSVSDAAAAQATLKYDSDFFELVSGKLTGEWDSSTNESVTEDLIKVTLKCIGAPGTSGSLSLSDKKASRLTGGDPPSESVSCSGGSKTVKNPQPAVPTPTAAPTPALTAAPTSARTPAPTPRRTETTEPSAESTPSLPPAPSLSLELGATPSLTPTTTPDPWAAAAQDIAKAEAGDTVRIKPTDAVLPAEVLALLKERGCILKIEMDHYICTIDGRELWTAPGRVIDLSLGMERDETLSEAADGKDLFQLHFACSGELPGRFVYTFKAKGCEPGDVLYLYYYYARAGVAECAQTAAVDADGNVSFSIYHYSGYFVADSLLDGAVYPKIVDAAARQTGAQQAQPGVTIPVLIICSVGAALLGIAAAFLLVRWAVKRREARR